MMPVKVIVNISAMKDSAAQFFLLHLILVGIELVFFDVRARAASHTNHTQKSAAAGQQLQGSTNDDNPSKGKVK